VGFRANSYNTQNQPFMKTNLTKIKIASFETRKFAPRIKQDKAKRFNFVRVLQAQPLRAIFTGE
jgi:hypothetical protein